MTPKVNIAPTSWGIHVRGIKQTDSTPVVGLSVETSVLGGARVTLILKSAEVDELRDMLISAFEDASALDTDEYVPTKGLETSLGTVDLEKVEHG